MRKLYHYIHSPAALFAFEAAGRHLSFTKAAEELNVSQPAISNAIRKVEKSLGVKLFERRHREVKLTDLGERFYNDVSFGLNHIYRSTQSIHIRKNSHHLSLMCSTAFAHYWMVPRLAQFKSEHKNIDIRVITTDRDLDMSKSAIDLAIRRGKGHFPGYQCRLIEKEVIYPVCSPDYVKHNGKPGHVADLLHHALIHLEEPYRLRPSWIDWFSAQNIKFHDDGKGLRFNDYSLVIQAALAGEGVAFGWHHLVSPLIERGDLVQFFEGTFDQNYGMYCLWPNGVTLSKQSKLFMDWISKNPSSAYAC